jgi:UDP-glucose 4-epimerase
MATESGAPVVVTGGAGAVGSVLVRSLLDRGATVRVVDNLSSGRREHLPSPAKESRLSITVADVREPNAIAEQIRGASAVWHLAANTDIRVGSADPRVDFDQGAFATFQVLESARRHDVPRFYFSSSSVVYGYPSVLPTPESYGPLQPESFYGAAKLAAEGMCSAFAHAYGIRAYMFRFANVIGPGMTHGVMYDFFDKLRKDPSRLEVLGDGRQSKSYLRTEDCVEGMLLATERAADTVNIFNLGTHDQTTVREIAEKIVAVHGGTARIEYTGGSRGWVGDVPVQLLSVEKIEKLGWRPRYSSGEAVDRTIEEMRRASRGRARTG